MKYSEEQIKKYLEILHNYTKNISDKPKMQQYGRLKRKKSCENFTRNLKAPMVCVTFVVFYAKGPGKQILAKTIWLIKSVIKSPPWI